MRRSIKIALLALGTVLGYGFAIYVDALPSQITARLSRRHIADICVGRRRPNRRAPLKAHAPRSCLIDDDKRLHELLPTYLEQNGFQVTGAPDGQRGLTALETETFDIVLLDVMMPGIDGLEVCRRIRAKSRVPILMLTAKGDETDRVVGLELGADDYIAKPFGPRELVARLRAVLAPGQPGGAVRDGRVVNEISIDVTGHKVRSRRTRGRAHRHRVRHLARPRSPRGPRSRCATRCSARRGAATSRWATARSTCTSRTCARSSATTRAPRRRSRRCAASATCW